MTTPTPDFGEPWFRVVQGKQHMIADRRDHFIVANDVKTKQEVVSRIIACVNACAGIPTDRLQPGSVKRLSEAVAESREQFRYMLEWFGENEPYPGACSEMDSRKSELDAALSPFQEPPND